MVEKFAAAHTPQAKLIPWQFFFPLEGSWHKPHRRPRFDLLKLYIMDPSLESVNVEAIYIEQLVLNTYPQNVSSYVGWCSFLVLGIMCVSFWNLGKLKRNPRGLGWRSLFAILKPIAEPKKTNNGWKNKLLPVLTSRLIFHNCMFGANTYVEMYIGALYNIWNGPIDIEKMHPHGYLHHKQSLFYLRTSVILNIFTLLRTSRSTSSTSQTLISVQWTSHQLFCGSCWF